MVTLNGGLVMVDLIQQAYSKPQGGTSGRPHRMAAEAAACGVEKMACWALPSLWLDYWHGFYTPFCLNFFPV